ncbi:MAG: hypothetical protein UU81_C0045G0006 [Microgenomates group bacterium GW2011_GWC1_41_8]|nr:MAG: hypothetical protein UU81_C0045G0006 [Microgenomates group bacterium GW2011_GWC1_41_8]KKT75337.1 MAG: hypothetical protein UW71_C0004G0028 [Parcubacteria group bacterium GW2011_GWB1_44_7]
MTNLEIFEFCKSKPEKHFDQFYFFVDKDKNLAEHIEKIKRIKEKLITLKEILKRSNTEKLAEQIFEDLSIELINGGSYSEFACFANACDTSINKVSRNKKLLRELTELYLQKREIIEIVPAEWVQAIIDKGASRRKGKSGEDKLSKILLQNGFSGTKTIKDFIEANKTFADFTGGESGDFSPVGVYKNFGVKFGKKTQGKKLDLIIKKDGQIYFLEAKHLKVGGGVQDKQIIEIINLLNFKTGKENHHTVSFLDGIYSNALLSIGVGSRSRKLKNKIQKQYVDVIKSLKNNPGNFWLNTAGFEKFFL